MHACRMLASVSAFVGAARSTCACERASACVRANGNAMPWRARVIGTVEQVPKSARHRPRAAKRAKLRISMARYAIARYASQDPASRSALPKRLPVHGTYRRGSMRGCPYPSRLRHQASSRSCRCSHAGRPGKSNMRRMACQRAQQGGDLMQYRLDAADPGCCVSVFLV
jgi:hypothetical protein